MAMGATKCNDFKNLCRVISLRITHKVKSCASPQAHRENNPITSDLLVRITLLVLATAIPLGQSSQELRPIHHRLSSDSNAIIGSSWMALRYYDGTSLLPLLPGSTITLKFEERQIRGSGGCNSYFGTGTYLDSSFLFDDGIAWTEKACIPWILNEQESSYLRNFNASIEYTVLDDVSNDDVLELRDGDTKAVIARFVPIDSDGPPSSKSQDEPVSKESVSVESAGRNKAAAIAILITISSFMQLFLEN